VLDRIQVRTASPEDEATVRGLLEASYPVLLTQHYGTELIAEAMPLLTMPDAKLLRSDRYYVAELDEVAVGCGGWSQEPPPGAEAGDDTAIIRRFAVPAAFAGKGVGRKLFQHCETAIREGRLRRMLVRSSLNAEPFYAALGFRLLRPVDMPLPSGRGLPCVLMERAV
jgi:GNAT superfamily N-acetyltransferase